MRVLVTGAAGFLGSETFRLLKNLGHDVVGTSRSREHEAVYCDLSSTIEVATMLDDVRADAIVNCAAVVDFGGGALQQMYDVNVLLPGLLAAWTRKEHAYLMQISGTLVHGINSECIRSDSVAEPDTDYGRSKWMAEELIRVSGVSAGIIRFCGIFGKNGPDHLGINRAIRAAMKGEAPTVIGSGNAKRNYIHVSDAALVIEYCLKNRVSGVRFAGGPEVMSVLEMLQTICDVSLPGQHPKFRQGADGGNQIVQSSPDIPRGKTMAEALLSEQ